MDLSIPGTFYPSALPVPWIWGLFLLACLATLILSGAIVKRVSLRAGLLLALPIAIAMLAASSVASMVVMFFVHDI